MFWLHRFFPQIACHVQRPEILFFPHGSVFKRTSRNFVPNSGPARWRGKFRYDINQPVRTVLDFFAWQIIIFYLFEVLWYFHICCWRDLIFYSWNNEFCGPLSSMRFTQELQRCASATTFSPFSPSSSAWLIYIRQVLHVYPLGRTPCKWTIY